MSSYSDAGGPAESFGRARWQGGCGAWRWRPLEVAAVVIGFAIWWPLGLGLIGLKVAQRRGYRFDDARDRLREAFRGGFGPAAATRPAWRPFSTTGNAAFDDWRAAEMAKLDEERRKLDAAQRDFAEHLDTLRKARDRDEFDAFMRARAQGRPAAD